MKVLTKLDVRIFVVNWLDYGIVNKLRREN
jgi:hypothetical protein